MTVKTCKKCLITKDASNFRHNNAVCKNCIKIQRRKKEGGLSFEELRIKNLSKKGSMEFIYNIRLSIRNKVNNRLLGIMPRTTDRAQIKLNKKLTTARWREAHRGYSAEWARKNRFKARASWHKRQELQKRTNDGTVTSENLYKMYHDQQGKCNICQKNLLDTYHIDHIIPLSKNGRHSISNIQFLCPFCNLSKANKIINTINYVRL